MNNTTNIEVESIYNVAQRAPLLGKIVAPINVDNVY